jgi:hypothetical protein
MNLSQFDPQIRRIVEQLADEALVPMQVLIDELQQYVEELEAHTSNAGFFDDGTAMRVAALCWKLLGELPAEPNETQHRLTQLAINYFVLAEDAQDDNHSLAGFDDDMEVVVAVINELGFAHLLTDESSGT